jgi:hypothetical protein
MPRKPEPEKIATRDKQSDRMRQESAELSAAELDQVSGGKKLPGKKKPPTLTLK